MTHVQNAQTLDMPLGTKLDESSTVSFFYDLFFFSTTAKCQLQFGAHIHQGQPYECNALVRIKLQGAIVHV